MNLAGVSARRVEDITVALWGSRVSTGTVSVLNKKIYSRIKLWRNRPNAYSYPYLYPDDPYLKRNWDGEVHNTAILVAAGVDEDGFRNIVGIYEEFWRKEEICPQNGLQSFDFVVKMRQLGENICYFV